MQHDTDGHDMSDSDEASRRLNPSKLDFRVVMTTNDASSSSWRCDG